MDPVFLFVFTQKRFVWVKCNANNNSHTTGTNTKHKMHATELSISYANNAQLDSCYIKDNKRQGYM